MADELSRVETIFNEAVEIPAAERWLAPARGARPAQVMISRALRTRKSACSISGQVRESAVSPGPRGSPLRAVGLTRAVQVNFPFRLAVLIADELERVVQRLDRSFH